MYIGSQLPARTHAGPGPSRATVAAAVALILSAASTPTLAQTVSSSDVQRLKEQVEELQRQIDKIQAQQQAQQQAAPAVAPAAPAAASKPAPRVVQSGANRFSLESADGRNSIALSGRLHLDVGGYVSYTPDNSAVGPQSLSSGFNARRARIGATGKLGGAWSYTFIYDGGNSADNTAAGIQTAQVSYIGFKGVQIDLPGYSEVPFTLETSESSNDTLFMERAVPVNIATGLGTGDFRANTGVRFFTDRFWAGAYLTGPQYGDSHANLHERFGAFERVSAQLLADENYSLHLGVGVSELLKAPDAGIDNTATPPAPTPASVTLSDRPELRIDPTALFSTGALGSLAHPVTGATVYNVELAAGWSGLFVQGEYFHYVIQRRDLSNNGMNGAYGEIGWVLTGEHRKYDPLRASYSGISPAHPLTLDGGFGAWELAARYSYTDLTDQFTLGLPLKAQPNAIDGGKLKNTTVGVNWYINSNLRLMLDYVHSDLDKANGKAVTGAALGVPVGYKMDAIALRTQVAW